MRTIGAVVFLGALCASEDEQSTLTKVGQPAPEFAIQQLDGANFKLPDQRGKVVVLNFLNLVRTMCRETSRA